MSLLGNFFVVSGALWAQETLLEGGMDNPATMYNPSRLEESLPLLVALTRCLSHHDDRLARISFARYLTLVFSWRNLLNLLRSPLAVWDFCCGQGSNETKEKCLEDSATLESVAREGPLCTLSPYVGRG